MAPFTKTEDINKAIINLLEENVDDQTRPEKIKQNRAWIKYYKNKLNENK